ncbi:hypothetical protein FM038_012015 [Shewanella eurypsychrophilus]|uniref:Lipoprotein n=1 Tax=Shewanella eurypsychrophilus TaxID=2593656 RepID=A0ABX6V621_9GAMM|nr:MULTISPECIES: hypothetical protein [Shewanella]QFU22797.1 hypothetical protein FS418_13595 [Shewanella sp. YLB-09]QPG58085.1 hypothetical protein FM038_012015 [Shewanella eurypsychrophilus]
MLRIKLFSKKHSWNLLVILLLVSACTPQDDEQIEGQSSGIIEDKSLCNFSMSPCYKQVSNINLSLLITPFNTPSEKPLTIELTSSEAITDINMRIEGRDMFMGVIPVNLAKVNEKQYNGQLIFGSCSSNYMVWRALVSFKKNGLQHVAIFDFLADSGK